MFKIGIVFFIIGTIVAAWGLIIFHKVRTTTVPGEISAILVTTGPCRFNRNPMYVGLTLAPVFSSKFDRSLYYCSCLLTSIRW
nr:methyltransferase [Clostridium kluyveri]